MTPKTVASAPLLHVQEIPIADIVPSATNPRKSVDQAQLAELAESIKSVGVQVPLSLRFSLVEGDHTYEIVGGERRWRAAQIAGRETVPAIVREMSDAECRESQLVENLQRADLSPMEEAEAYRLLLYSGERAGSLPIEVLAAKVGKTVQYVTQRLRLLQLIPEAREALRCGLLNLTIALLIARLQPADQEKATLVAIDSKRVTKGKDLAERIADAKECSKQEHSWNRTTPATESELRKWIGQNTLLTLKGVAWRLDDPDLIPLAGPCTECPKRAGNSSALFGDLAAEGDTCTDPTCYAKKRRASVKEVLKHSDAVKLSSSESHLPLKEGATALKQGQWVEAKKGSCPAVVQGVTEDGHLKTVCPDQKCKVHKHRVDKPLAKGQSASDWEAKQKAAAEKEAAYVAAESPIRRAVYAAIRPKLKGAKLLRVAVSAIRVDWRIVAELRGVAVKGDGWQAREAAEKALSAVFEKLKDADVEGFLADAIASEAIEVKGYRHDERKDDRKALWNIGQLLGVDCDAIAAKIEKETAAVAQAKPTTSSPKPSPAASSPKAAKKAAKKGGRK